MRYVFVSLKGYHHKSVNKITEHGTLESLKEASHFAWGHCRFKDVMFSQTGRPRPPKQRQCDRLARAACHQKESLSNLSLSLD